MIRDGVDMLSKHYVVQPASDAGVLITCQDETGQTFVMVSNAVIEHRIGIRSPNALQKRCHVVEHAVEFITISEIKRCRFRPSTDVTWILLRDILAARRQDDVALPPVTVLTPPLSGELSGGLPR
jgi:hypothetical protein